MSVPLDKMDPSPPYVPPTRVVSATTGPEPAQVVCPSCHAEIVTQTEQEANTKTHIYALLLCLALCWPCVCLPYCCTSCRDTVHRCPRCKSFIGVYRR
ncbi:lipopolysaccharide-induced tumor necrosis factor-alpha factor homolog [Anopheles merus]|uniref:AGAP009054-PA n=4 Tax=gambiae species complex TaxID=44542 RepID=A0NGC4_ANOGA|nr:lipopolysaccharide-induced tumor necrosis factor-alpha factor homolog [Anopheles gambiae]XP_040237758.2 lipopolysaccharide-induced tumor necrosis factor-alpha factor homolog [Anopheles coluzzii]XP_041777472.1 lipopolysaccharide-induced tumor necrosis factor-alpha factor homolog [Anopheles merus]EAU75930.1 AGAP009054-PA [Anopheles gambiae str. PEST]